MIVSINQPAYLPWLGYFDRIAASDVHVVLDHVQFEKNSFTNRNRIRTPDGTTWLTIPVLTSGRFGALEIDQLRIADSGRWARKHAQALRSNYGKSASFKALWPEIEAHFSSPEPVTDEPQRFLPSVERLNRTLGELLGIKTPTLRSSSMALTSTKSALVLEVCQKVGADRYLSGPLGRDYLDREAFMKAGIEVVFHDYAPAPYQQLWPGFHSHLAAVDAIFSLGEVEATRTMIAGRRIAGMS